MTDGNRKLGSHSFEGVFESVYSTSLPGVLLLKPRRHADQRGHFVKTFHASAFRELGLDTDFREQYYSVSHRGVLRGMHFQSPPMDHAKLVYCADGSIFDAVVDLRSDERFGRHEEFQLSSENAHILYLPAGVAHGFCVISETAVTVYNVTKEYSPDNDSGVRWDSCGIAWPVENPCISERDRRLPAISEIGKLFRI